MSRYDDTPTLTEINQTKINALRANQELIESEFWENLRQPFLEASAPNLKYEELTQNNSLNDQKRLTPRDVEMQPLVSSSADVSDEKLNNKRDTHIDINFLALVASDSSIRPSSSESGALILRPALTLSTSSTNKNTFFTLGLQTEASFSEEDALRQLVEFKPNDTNSLAYSSTRSIVDNTLSASSYTSTNESKCSEGQALLTRNVDNVWTNLGFSSDSVDALAGYQQCFRESSNNWRWWLFFHIKREIADIQFKAGVGFAQEKGFFQKAHSELSNLSDADALALKEKITGALSEAFSSSSIPSRLESLGIPKNHEEYSYAFNAITHLSQLAQKWVNNSLIGKIASWIYCRNKDVNTWAVKMRESQEDQEKTNVKRDDYFTLVKQKGFRIKVSPLRELLKSTLEAYEELVGKYEKCRWHDDYVPALLTQVSDFLWSTSNLQLIRESNQKLPPLLAQIDLLLKIGQVALDKILTPELVNKMDFSVLALVFYYLFAKTALSRNFADKLADYCLLRSNKFLFQSETGLSNIIREHGLTYDARWHLFARDSIKSSRLEDARNFALIMLGYSCKNASNKLTTVGIDQELLYFTYLRTTGSKRNNPELRSGGDFSEMYDNRLIWEQIAAANGSTPAALTSSENLVADSSHSYAYFQLTSS